MDQPKFNKGDIVEITRGTCKNIRLAVLSSEWNGHRYIVTLSIDGKQGDYRANESSLRLTCLADKR